MNLRENFEKIRCARLHEQKTRLQKELDYLQEVYKRMISETSTAMMGDGRNSGEYDDYTTGPATRSMTEPTAPGQEKQGPQYSPQAKGRRRKATIGDGQAKSEDETDTEEPFELAKPQQGFALTPQAAFAQKDVLTKYFDNPSTAQREVPQEATWQNLNQAVGNYSGEQVRNLMRQQRMLG